MKYSAELVFSLIRASLKPKNQLHKQYRIIIVLVIMLCMPISASASVSCKGRFVNPISDVCWSCLLPISIGQFKVGGGMSPKKRDTKNPSSPICACSKGGQPVPIPGISLGFWEPVRMIDVTRSKYCMVGLGIDFGGEDNVSMGTYNRAYGKGRVAHNSFYHLHYYIYPLIYWLELITDLICLEQTSFDVAYLSELDPTWNDEKLQTLLNPEAFLFGNPAAQAACALDCASASVDMPRDELFWCAGCWGNIYPFSGANADHVGGVQNSSLLAGRILAKMHRVGLAKSTSTTDASINGKICKKQTALKIKKSQYKLQMLYPKASRGAIGCWPLGLSDMAYSSFKEYPWDGQDWSYLVWRKRNCCAF
jgi:conjugal transfer pilus assembly protein TraU